MRKLHLTLCQLFKAYNFSPMHQLQYAAWSQASDIMDDLAKMGLTNPRAVIGACEKDPQLLGRLVAMVLGVTELCRWWYGKLGQVLTNSDYLRPYFDRYRVSFSFSSFKLFDHDSALTPLAVVRSGQPRMFSYQSQSDILQGSSYQAWNDRGEIDRVDRKQHAHTYCPSFAAACPHKDLGV